MRVVLIIRCSHDSQARFLEGRDRVSAMDEPEHQPRDMSADNYPPLPRRVPTFNSSQEFADLRFFIETNLRDIHNSVTGHIDVVRGDIHSLSQTLRPADARGSSGRSNGAAVSP